MERLQRCEYNNIPKNKAHDYLSTRAAEESHNVTWILYSQVTILYESVSCGMSNTIRIQI